VRHSSIVLGLALAAGAGCRSGDRPDPVYDPARTLVEVVATLQAGRDADLYRYDAPKDVSGDNLFRASLARLARYDERLRDPAFRPAVAFAQALASERLLDFDRAAALYEEVAGSESELAAEARRLAELPRRLAGIVRPLPSEARPDEVLIGLGEQRAELRRVRAALPVDEPRRCLVDVSIERLDVREREFLWRLRVLSGNGTRVALDAAEQVVSDHRESRRLLEHSLRLGDLYAELAQSYVVSVDPGGFDFDAAYARTLLDAAARVYGEVAAIDGRPEREEARARLLQLEALAERAFGAGGLGG